MDESTPNERRNAYERGYRRSYIYNLGAKGFDRMFNEAGGRCEICDKELIHSTARVDHDHACCPRTRATHRSCGRCVRGILCHACNTALGLLADDPKRFTRAIEYLATRGLNRVE